MLVVVAAAWLVIATGAAGGVEGTSTAQVPSPPKYLNARKQSDTEIRVTWDVPGNTPKYGTVYDLRWRIDRTKNESQKHVQGLRGSTLVRGLRPFTVYVFRIRRGHRSNGTLTWGRFTNTTLARTGEGIPTAPPANVTAFNTTSISIMVRWDQVPKVHRHSDMLGYKVCYQRADQKHSLLFCTAVYGFGLELGGLSHYKPYLVTVLAFTNEGEGPPCKPILVRTDEFVPVRGPRLLSINSTTTSVKLRWAAIPQRHVNGILRGYDVIINAVHYRMTSALQVNASSLGVEVPGLRRNTTYRVRLRGFTRVRGIKRGGTFGSVHNFTIKFGCRAPQNISVFSSCSSCVNIQWAPVPPADPAKPIKGYHVTYVAGASIPQTKITGAHETRLKMNGLRKFTAYYLTVAAVTSDGLGESSRPIKVVTLEDVPSRAPETVTLQSLDPNSIMVSWSPIPKEYRHGVLLQYNVYYRNQATKVRRSLDAAGVIHTRSVNASVLSLELTGLTAFSSYAVWLSGSTSKGGGPSTTPKIVQTEEDVPTEAPQGVKAESEGPTTIDVQWQPIPPAKVPGILRGYRVTYRKKNSKELNEISLNATHHRVIIKGLQPLTEYELSVAGFTNWGTGPESVKVHVITPSTARERPWDLKVKILAPRSVKVTWQSPSIWEDHVTRFMVQWRKTLDPNQEGQKMVNAGKPYWRETVIGGLAPYTSYSFSVKEETSGERWSEFSKPREVMMPEDVPSEPRNLSLVGKSGVRVVLGWRAPHFPNGVIRKYEIHFAADSGATKTDTFATGIQAESLTYTMNLPDVASKYTIRVQAFNSLPGKISDVLVVHHSPVDVLDSKKPNDFKSKLLWLICGLTAIVLLLIAVLVIVIIRRSMRRSRSKRTKCTVSAVSQPAKPRRPIPIASLKEHCDRFHANNDALFTDEFKSLDLLTWKSPCTASQAPMNRPKNRFYDINANDLTRVVLSTFMDIPGSDYINANYIDSHNSPARFIATQGPLEHTVADFWRMVWEKNCPVVVMLENFDNKPGHHLCEQYWPCAGSAEYGPVAVSLLSTTEMSEWTLREFIIWSTDPECMDKRELKHLQYKTWPDQGVPHGTGAFLAFCHRFRTLLPTEPGGPIVVHCSAGVGRTGTFIAIESLMEQMAVEGVIDVYGFVAQMRKQRSFSVQTKEQYRFIYEALRDVSLCGMTEISSEELNSTFRCKGVEDPAVFARRTTEFECVELSTTVEPGLCSSAMQRANVVKNRSPEILPYDWNRVRLPPSRGVPCSDYINASFIDAYNAGKAFIATQNPLENTAKDFWKMVWDQRSSIVIMLNKIKDPEEDEAVQYWPDQTDGCTRYGKVKVTKIDEEVLEGLTQRMFQVGYHGREESLVVYHFQFHDWQNSRGLVYLYEQVQKVKPEHSQGPIIVHCSDGAALTGVFLALSLSIERLEFEGTLDMYETVRWLRAQRPGLVQTADQYNFCYEGMRSYLTWRTRGATNDYSDVI